MATTWTYWNSPNSGTTDCSTADNVWYDWNTSSGTVSVTNDSYTYSGNSETWGRWNTYIYIDSTEIQDETVWIAWDKEQNRYEEVLAREDPKFYWSTERHRAERAQRELERIWRDYLAEEHQREREEAESVAQELLLDLIGEERLKVYEQTGRVLVHGRKFDYIVQKSGYVRKIDKDKVVDLCVHLRQQTKYPPTDNVIALKLAIEGDEREFLKTANHHRPRNPRDGELEAA